MRTPSHLGAILLAGMLVSAPALADIEVSEAHVRATPPGVDVSAAFFRLNNSGDENMDLTGAHADKARAAELHTHGEKDGMMQMRRVERIGIPAHGSHRLQPGGDHLMLIGLSGPLAEGDSVQLSLEFSNGETLEVSAPVKAPATEMGAADGDHGHPH